MQAEAEGSDSYMQHTRPDSDVLDMVCKAGNGGEGKSLL